MKKKIAIAAIVAAALTLSSCGNPTMTYSGAYWNKDPTITGVIPISETLVYSVSSVYTSEFSATEMKSDSIALEIDGDLEKSYYKTELTATENGTYIYKTTLNVSGKYVFDGGEYEFKDDRTYSETEFKGLDGNFVPVRSTRTAENVIPGTDKPTGADSFVKMGYTATIYYGESSLDAEVVPNEDSKNGFVYKEKPVTIKNYLSATYLDEDIMIFAFRAMKFSGSTSYSFNTVDKLGQSLSTISLSPVNATASDSAPTTTPITLSGYKNNGNLMVEQRFDTFGVSFKTTGKYSKAFKYVYYAVNPTDEYGNEVNETRHIPIKIYQPELYNSGYLCFTLTKAF